MHCLLLSAGCPSPAPGEGKRILFDAWDGGEDAISLPARLAGELTHLRDEHAVWAYETGKLSMGCGTLADRLRGGASLSMWWTSLLYERHPKVSPALYDVYRLRCLERLLLELGCTSLEVHGLAPRVAACVGALCRAWGWKVTFTGTVQAQRPSLLRRLYAATPAPVRALARLVVWLATVRRRLPRTDLKVTDAQTGTVITYFPNISVPDAEAGRLHSRYWESLHTAFAAQAGPEKSPPVRWVFIRFPSPQGSLARCVAWKEGFEKSGCSGVSFNYLEEFLSAGDIFRAMGRWFSIATASLCVQTRARKAFYFKDSKLDLWPLLGPDYSESFRGWRCLERCLQNLGLASYVRLAGPQRWYVFPMENCPWERMVTHAVHQAGTGPVYGAQHSAIRPADFRYFDAPATWTDPETATFQPDLVIGNGASACAQWRSAGVPEARLERASALRYLYLAGSGRLTCQDSERVLVVTSFFADETDAHLELLAACLREGVLKASKVTVKPHPYLPVTDRLRTLLGDRAGELRLSMEPMAAALAEAPVVWASNSTTAALEAAICGLPVIVMPPHHDFDLCPLQDVPGLVRTATVEDVRRAMKHPYPLDMDPDYLCLDPGLARWKCLLGLRDPSVATQGS